MHALEVVPFLIDPVMRDLVKRYAVDVMGHKYPQRWDDEWQVADDIRTAEYIGNRPFYIDRNVDKRGRINSVPHFNFDRGDNVRSMIRFARGMQLDRQDPTLWLEIHCANCHGATDKHPYDDRRQWADRNRELIQKIAAEPEGTFELWMSGGADPNGGLLARAADLLASADRKSKFCFVAACRELKAAWESPATFETHLPIGFDGSCNGLQHLALIARDPETARMVNVGPSRVSKIPDPDGKVIVISTWPREPRDVYTVVVAETMNRLLADEDPWAPWWLDRFKQLSDKHTRKLIKTPAMTFAYAATQGTMAEEILDVYRTLPCANSHPSYDGNRPEGRRDGCSYLAGKVIEACRSRLLKPTEVMEYIQDCAQRCTDRGLFLSWMTPSGFWVLHRYHEHEEPETFNLITQGVRVRHNLAVEFKDEIWEGKTINAVAANFVHSLDAAHAVKVVNAANSRYIHDIITVHDCYYCLAPQAIQLIPIINYELYEMYRTRDVLADLRDRNAVLHEHSCSVACRTQPQRAVVPRLIPLWAKDAHDPFALIFSPYAFS